MQPVLTMKDHTHAHVMMDTLGMAQVVQVSDDLEYCLLLGQRASARGPGPEGLGQRGYDQILLNEILLVRNSPTTEFS